MSAWARASRTSSGLYLMEPPGQVQLIPPKEASWANPSVNLLLRDPSNSGTEARPGRSPEGSPGDHTQRRSRVRPCGQGGSVRHAPRCEDRLSKPSTPLPAAAATPGRDGLGLHAVAETGPLPLTSPKGCGTIPAHASRISWNASSGKPPTLPGTPAHRCDTTCLCTDQRNSRARVVVLGGVGC